MKKTITSIAAAVLMTLSFSSFAGTNNKTIESKTAKEILSNYVKSTSIGIHDLDKSEFTADFQYVNSISKESFGKKAYLKFLKENKGLTYDCTTTHKIVNQLDNEISAVSTYRFSNFTRVDHISMIQTKDGWKINKIVSSYK